MSITPNWLIIKRFKILSADKNEGSALCFIKRGTMRQKEFSIRKYQEERSKKEKESLLFLLTFADSDVEVILYINEEEKKHKR